jgi:hypothetical protein
MTREEERGEKIPYERPRLIVIDLSADEVLAIGCKLVNMGFNFGGVPCATNACVTTDSS